MGLVLRTNAHMGHKCLHKHAMRTFTFGHTRTCTHTGLYAQVLECTHAPIERRQAKEIITTIKERAS